jgi:hypothetical protein
MIYIIHKQHSLINNNKDFHIIIYITSNNMKIGILIPSTSKNRDWKTMEESYLYKHTLKSFLLTYDKEHTYVFYIGIDRNDKVYDNEDNKNKLNRFCSIMKNTSIEFHYMDNVAKGHLTVMWNQLFKTAYSDGCEYFFQCGDDIEFKTNGWINECIRTLQHSNGIGMTGPINNNTRILTQSFVSRKHMDLFGYYFPPEIVNWFCDDWINDVYRGIQHFYPLNNHVCLNVGGEPRYAINNQQYQSQLEFSQKFGHMRTRCANIVKRDLERITSRV